MTSTKPQPTHFAPSHFAGLERVHTPALIIYPDLIDANISATLRLVDGQPQRWRPHVKTAKLESTMRQLVASGIRQFKCATTLELIAACAAGGDDVLFAYPSTGMRARRIREIASQYPEVRISVIAENKQEIEIWRGSRIEIFIDVNPGMNRTGIGQWRLSEIVDLARHIQRQGSKFAGLHYYDGHHREPSIEDRKAAAFPGYEQLMKLVQAIRNAKIEISEVVTSGTPALPCALSFPGFQSGEIPHKISTGTVVYNDLTSLSQLPSEWGYQPAAVVATAVISHPAPGQVTFDAGHKTVSADSGFPNCVVMGRPELKPLHPSEEHLPIRVPEGTALPEIGEIFYLLPKHICTTVNNFDHAVLVKDSKILDVVSVTARGREIPFSEEIPAP